MSSRLRVLLVEDSEADAQLVLEGLRSGGFQPEHQRVETSEAMTSALADGTWDVVISDYAMPRFSGVAALEVLQQSGLDVPFIVVTGTVGEDLAVGMMRAGAHDYLMKGELTRLAPAVERELQEAEQRRQRRQAEQLLRESEARFRDLFENAHDLIQSVRPDGTLLYVNRAWRETLGYNAAEIPCLSLMRDIVHPSSARHCGELFQRLLAGDAVDRVEAVFRAKDGRAIILEGNCSCHFVNGQPAYTRQIFRDVTVRKQAEEEVRKLSSAVNQTANSVLITDRRGLIEYVNPAFERTTGYGREEVIGKTPRLLKSGEHDQKYYESLWNTVVAGGTFYAEFVNRKKSGERYHTEQTITPIRDPGGVITGFVSTGHDITERKEAELRIQRLNRVYTILSDINHTIVRVREPREVLEAACRIAVEKGGFRMAWIGYVDATTQAVKPVAHAGEAGDYLEKLKIVLGDDPHGRGPTAIALREGTHVVCNDVERDPCMAPWREDALRRGYRSCAAFPLKIRSEIIGCFNFYAREAGFFDDEELRLLDELAVDIGFALEVSQQEAERQRAEEGLRESEDRYRSLVEESPEAIGIYQDDKLVFINSTGVRQLGAKSKKELLDRGDQQIIHPDDLPAALDRVRRRLAGETGMYPAEVRYRRVDGTTVPVEVIATPITFGGRAAVQFIARDITERKRTETALLKSEARLEEAQRIAHVGSWEWDAATDTPTWSPELCAILEVDPAKPALSVAEQHKLYTPESMQRMHAAIEQTMRTGTPYEIELERVREDGTSRWLLARGEPIYSEQRQVTGLRGTALDITERRQAEDHLRDSAALYHSLVESLPQHVFRKDRAGRFTFGNGLFCQGLGKPLAEILGKTDLDLFPGALASKYRQDDERVMESGLTFEGEEEHRLASGKTIIVSVVKTPLRDATGQIIGVQGIAWDITEKKQLGDQFLRAQRLESIGNLASGVAHDLNNALAPILMSVELLRLEFPDTASRYLEMIQTSAKRGADMVKQLLTFARGAEGERLPVKPQRLLKEMEKLVKGTFPKNIELRTHYAKDLRTVLGDATQLHQVLLNLCVNARDAMPEGGTLTLEAENKELDATYVSTVPEAKPGHHVVWRVMDTGAGIPPETQDHIFEPFFSTKGPGKGTGLGLSTALGIIKNHGGFIRVYSTPGQGSTFAVYLPACGSATSDTSFLTKSGMTFRGHGESILVVDDEVAVRRVLRAVLTKMNFKVLTASDGTAALIQVEEHRTELRVVITDLHMPHMDGLSFVRVLKGRLPEAGIIVMSGRVDEPAAAEFKKLGVHAVMEKPFTQEKLVETLKTVFPK